MLALVAGKPLRELPFGAPKATLQASDKRLMASFFNHAQIINWYRKDMPTAAFRQRLPLYQPHDSGKPSRTQFFTDQLNARTGFVGKHAMKICRRN